MIGAQPPCGWLKKNGPLHFAALWLEQRRFERRARRERDQEELEQEASQIAADEEQGQEQPTVAPKRLSWADELEQDQESEGGESVEDLSLHLHAEPLGVAADNAASSAWPEPPRALPPRRWQKEQQRYELAADNAAGSDGLGPPVPPQPPHQRQQRQQQQHKSQPQAGPAAANAATAARPESPMPPQAGPAADNAASSAELAPSMPPPPQPPQQRQQRQQQEGGSLTERRRQQRQRAKACGRSPGASF
jgi:hypothetical protein